MSHLSVCIARFHIAVIITCASVWGFAPSAYAKDDLFRCNLPTLYSGKNYRGQSLRFQESQRVNLTSHNLNNRVSSLCIPEGWSVTLYDKKNMKGTSATLTGHVRYPDLRNFSGNWNNRASSVMVRGRSNQDAADRQPGNSNYRAPSSKRPAEDVRDQRAGAENTPAARDHRKPAGRAASESQSWTQSSGWPNRSSGLSADVEVIIKRFAIYGKFDQRKSQSAPDVAASVEIDRQRLHNPGGSLQNHNEGAPNWSFKRATAAKEIPITIRLYDRDINWSLLAKGSDDSIDINPRKGRRQLRLLLTPKSNNCSLKGDIRRKTVRKSRLQNGGQRCRWNFVARGDNKKRGAVVELQVIYSVRP